MASDTKEFTTVEMGSERNFGLVIGGVFAIIALWPMATGGAVRLWSLVVAVGFLGFAVLFPRALRSLNILWFKFGLLLGKVVTPIIMAILFATTVVPTGLVMRALGKDGLRLKRQTSGSHWIVRDEPGPQKGSMKDQF